MLAVREFSHLLRSAYVVTLSNIEYLGVQIPVNDEFAKRSAIVPLGNGLQMEAYILIANQTSNDNSYKCAVNSNASLQVQCVTKFDGNSGGKLHSELIANEVLKAIFPDDNSLTINIPGFNVWRITKESSRNLPSENSTNRIFNQILIFNHSIQQL